MTGSNSFNGFPQQALDFFSELARNNNREWFEAHKQDYNQYVRDPAQSFVAVLGARLQTLVPQLIVDTRTNGSGALLRINRDTRFSSDKSPYKTKIALWIWEGMGRKMEMPGFGMEIDPSGAGLAAGVFGFGKSQLEDFRAAVTDKVRGAALAKIADDLRGRGYRLEGEHYKRVPSGHDADHPRAEFLKYAGLWASGPQIEPAVVTSADFVEACMERFEVMAPLQKWVARIY